MLWIINQTYGCPSLGTKIVAVLESHWSPAPVCLKWWEDYMVKGPVLMDVPPVGPPPLIRVEKRGSRSGLPTGEFEDLPNPCDVEYTKSIVKRLAVLARWYGLDAKNSEGNPQSLNEVLVAMLVKEHKFQKAHYISMDLSERLGLI